MNYLFPIIAAVLWGANTVVTKLSSQVLFPIEIGFFRWVLAAIVLLPFALRGVASNWGYISKNIPKIIVLGLLGGVIFQCIAYYAAPYTTATNMGIIQSLTPIMALVLACLFLSHVTSGAAIGGIIVSAIGVTVVVSHGDIAGLVKNGVNIGDALMLVGTFAFALYSFFVNKWALRIPLVQSVFLQAIVAVVALLPVYLASPKHDMTLQGAAYISFAGVAASIVAPFVWMHGIHKLGAARISIFFNLVPVVTAILATFALSEKLVPSVLVGGGLAIAGVVIAEVFRPRAALKQA